MSKRGIAPTKAIILSAIVIVMAIITFTAINLIDFSFIGFSFVDLNSEDSSNLTLQSDNNPGICSDGIDNDGDGLIDELDDCDSGQVIPDSNPEIIVQPAGPSAGGGGSSSGGSNAGETDSGDEEEQEAVCGNNVLETGEQCDDGNNNNGDGCSVVCEVEGELGSCNDGIDNDEDGLIDWMYDLGCYGEEDNSEFALSRGSENGWTTYDKSANTQIIYVSSSVGNDSWSGFAPDWNGTDGPLKTIDKAYSLMRDGFPDWMLLRRGDTFNEIYSLQWEKSGESASKMMVISTYGTSKEKPLFMIDDLAGWRNKKNGPGGTGDFVNNLAIHGMHFYAYKKDPSSPEFDPTNDVLAIERFVPGDNFLLEDNLMEYAGLTMYIGMDRGSNYEVRRNFITGSYSVDSHAQGIFTRNIDGLVLEENVFDHNGWNSDFDLAVQVLDTNINDWRIISDGTTGIIIQGASYDLTGLDFSGINNLDDAAVILESKINNLPLNGTVRVDYKNSFFIFASNFGLDSRIYEVETLNKSSQSGTELRGFLIGNNTLNPNPTQFNHNAYLTSENRNITAVGNIFSRASASGIQARPGGIIEDNFFIENVGSHVGRTSSEYVPGGVNGTFKNNVVLRAYFTSGFDDRGGVGFEADHINNFVVEDNIFANFVRKNTGLFSGGDHEGIKDLTLRNNIVYNTGASLSICCLVDDYNSSDKTLKIYGNIFQTLENDSQARVVFVKFEDFTQHLEFYNNTYWNGLPNKWFRINGYNTEMNLTEWVGHVGETDSKAEKVEFLDPRRNISTYLQTLDVSGDLDEFMDLAKQQGRLDWHSEYTAYQINDHIRGGFVRTDLLADSGEFDNFWERFVSLLTGGVVRKVDSNSGITGNVVGNSSDYRGFMTLIMMSIFALLIVLAVLIKKSF